MRGCLDTSDIIPPHRAQEIPSHISQANIVVGKIPFYASCHVPTMTDKYPIGTHTESERLVRKWGFQRVFTWADGPYVSLRFLIAMGSLLKILETHTTRLIDMTVLRRI